jgi:C4-dicarboxylate transporter DctQ subunit
MKILAKTFDTIMNGMAWIGGAISIFMMLGISADVVARYFLNSPILGMQEVCSMLILWIVFLGAAWVLKKGGHINMDVILQMLKPKAQECLNLITSSICLVVTLVLFWFSIQVTWDVFTRGTIESGNLTINSGFVMMAIPIGCLPLFIQFGRKAYAHWEKFRGKVPEIPGSKEPAGQAGGIG